MKDGNQKKLTPLFINDFSFFHAALANPSILLKKSAAGAVCAFGNQDRNSQLQYEMAL
jgi:hypothetical protein